MPNDTKKAKPKKKEQKKDTPSKKTTAEVVDQKEEEQGKVAVASYKNAAISPQKARLVADLIRGMYAEKAMDILSLTEKKAAGIIRKVLKSAMANAEQNHDMDPTLLKITDIHVGEGTKYKRYRFVSRGRAHGYVKRLSHISIELSEKA